LNCKVSYKYFLYEKFEDTTSLPKKDKDNSRPKEKGHTMIYKTLHNKLKIEQQASHSKQGDWRKWWRPKTAKQRNCSAKGDGDQRHHNDFVRKVIALWSLKYICLVVFNATFNNILVILWRLKRLIKAETLPLLITGSPTFDWWIEIWFMGA